MATATIPIREKLGVKPPAQSIRWLNGMFFGEYGVGKTHLLGTAADHEMTRPLLIFDIDGGVQTLSNQVSNMRKSTLFKFVATRKSLTRLLTCMTALMPMVELYYKTLGVDTFSEFAGLDLAYVMRSQSRG